MRFRSPRAIEPDLLVNAYCTGHFPMADSRTDKGVFWLNPSIRGILPLDTFHVPKRLARTMRHSQLAVTVDRAFAEVIGECAAATRMRDNTWINGVIEVSYNRLFELGYAHSVEVWENSDLVGGLYGVSIGAAFFGESMFSRRTDASKIALVHLAIRLKLGQYRLLDTQFITEHLRQFGAVEIEREDYLKRLEPAVNGTADFYVLGGTGVVLAPGAVLQLTTQTS